MQRPKLEISAFLLLFAGSAVLAFLVFQPFLSVIVLAAVFAVLLHPLYERFLVAFGGGKNMASLAVVFGVLIFLVLPIFFLGGQILNEAKNLYLSMQGSGTDYAAFVQGAIENPVRRVFPNFSLNTREYAGKALAFVADNFTAVVSGAASVVLSTILLLMTLFFFLREGRKLLSSIIALSPLDREYDDEILTKIHRTIQSSVKSTILIAIAQGIAAGMGIYIFGVPNAVLWGSVGAIASLVPGIGTGLVMIPAAVYLFLKGNILAVAGFAAWGFLVVGFIDNFLRPYLASDSDILPVFVLFAVLGGLVFFGPLGLIFGPLALSFFVSMIHIYRALILEGRAEGKGGNESAS